jgi:hypothetical protein
MSLTRIQPSTIPDAAEVLGVRCETVRVWASRHKARKVGNVGKTAYYDFADLSMIKWYIDREMRVPKDPLERDAMRLRIATSRH